MTKRSCKRTTDENLIHKKAVEISKNKKGAKEFIAFLQLNKISGIGIVTINKLMKVAEDNGYL